LNARDPRVSIGAWACVCVRQVHAVGAGNAVPFQRSARGDLYDVKLAGTPAGMRCPRIEGMGVSLCPQRVEGTDTGTVFGLRVRAREACIRGHFIRCHL
jgi:hypothetical protein